MQAGVFRNAKNRGRNISIVAQREWITLAPVQRELAIFPTQQRLRPGRQAAHLRKRSSRLKSLELFFQAKECLENGDLGGTMIRIVRRPAMLPFLLRRLAWSLLRYAYGGPSERPASDFIAHIAARSRRLARRHAVNATKKAR